jgi:hypothetical protein
VEAVVAIVVSAGDDNTMQDMAVALFRVVIDAVSGDVEGFFPSTTRCTGCLRLAASSVI